MTGDKSGKRILVVEDDPNIMRLIVDTLEGGGHVVTSARDSSEALARLGSGRFDAAIVDFVLPGSDGAQLHRKLRAIAPSLADCTLFISGHLQSKENLDYFLTHGAGYLAKPFNAEDLLGSVDRIFEPT